METAPLGSLFRMRQFYEAYRDPEIVSALLTLLPWTHNLVVLSQCKLAEEREFYLRIGDTGEVVFKGS